MHWNILIANGRWLNESMLQMEVHNQKYRQHGTLQTEPGSVISQPTVTAFIFSNVVNIGCPVFTWYITSLPKWLVAFDHVEGRSGKILQTPPSQPPSIPHMPRPLSLAVSRSGNTTGARRDPQPLSVALYKQSSPFMSVRVGNSLLLRNVLQRHPFSVTIFSNVEPKISTTLRGAVTN